MATIDFTTWTQVDPNSRISATAPKMSWAGIKKNETAYGYFDFGANFFDGDYEHLFKIYIDSDENGGYICLRCMSNALGDMRTLQLASEHLEMVTYHTSDPNRTLYLYEAQATNGYTDSYTPALDTPYYCKFKRDESVGTYGTIYLYIYSDFDRTNLLDTLSVALHGEKADYRYLMIPCSYNDSGVNGSNTGYIENLITAKVNISGGGAAAAILGHIYH